MRAIWDPDLRGIVQGKIFFSYRVKSKVLDPKVLDKVKRKTFNHRLNCGPVTSVCNACEVRSRFFGAEGYSPRTRLSRHSDEGQKSRPFWKDCVNCRIFWERSPGLERPQFSNYLPVLAQNKPLSASRSCESRDSSNSEMGLEPFSSSSDLGILTLPRARETSEPRKIPLP